MSDKELCVVSECALLQINELKKELSWTQGELSDYEKHFKEDRDKITAMQKVVDAATAAVRTQDTEEFFKLVSALAEVNNPIGD